MEQAETLRRAYLHALGVTLWESRPKLDAKGDLRAQSTETASFDAAEVSVRPRGVTGDVSTMDWDTLQQTVAACTRCGLRAGCKQTVFGVGNRSAHWLFVGEAPG